MNESMKPKPIPNRPLEPIPVDMGSDGLIFVAMLSGLMGIAIFILMIIERT